MPTINYQTKEIYLKIGIFGARNSGRSTIIHALHQIALKNANTKLISHSEGPAASEIFDMAWPDTSVTIRGFSPVVHFHTNDKCLCPSPTLSVAGPTTPGLRGFHEVPAYDAGNHCVVKNANAVIFLADSDPEAMQGNTEQFEEMHHLMNECGWPENKRVLAVQYHKRDLPNAVSMAEMKTINTKGYPEFESDMTKPASLLAPIRAIAPVMFSKA